MSLLQLKKDYEQFMLDNYSETDIHWAGMKWNAEDYTEWIYFEYVGRSVQDCGLDNTEYNHNGLLNISIIAPTRFRVNEIADIILSLFKGQKIGGTFTAAVNILSTGLIEEIDKSYIDLTLDIKMV